MEKGKKEPRDARMRGREKPRPGCFPDRGELRRNDT